MKKVFYLMAILTLVVASMAFAQKAANFSEAKALSTQSGKPILLEFVHED
jgi:hypothetical protein